MTRRALATIAENLRAVAIETAPETAAPPRPATEDELADPG